MDVPSQTRPLPDANITRFLITLDVDNDPDNGITISKELSAALADISVDFKQDTSLFAQDAAILEVMKIVNNLYIHSWKGHILDF